MIVTNLVHVAQGELESSTPDVSPKKATVLVKTLVKNETYFPLSVVVKTKLLILQQSSRERSN